MVWILPVFGGLVNCDLSSFSGENRGGVVVNSWWIAGESVVAMQANKDVHYVGLKLSDLERFSWSGAF
jgi:hypothetical protein